MLAITLAKTASRFAGLPQSLITRVLCLGAIGSNISMWIAAGYTLSVVGKAHAQGGQGSLIPQENISISLPIYVISILATAGFTWAVAQHDRKNDRRIDEATEAVEKRLSGEIDDLKATMNKLLRRLGSKDITDT